MAAAAASDLNDGPVLSVINKRIRALRKKYNRIVQMEESLSQGKTLNKEQEEVLHSKPSVVAGIDELEKLRQPLSAAVAEEINLAVQHRPAETLSSEEGSEPKLEKGSSAVEDLLNLLYFGSMFDVKSQSDFTATMLTRTHERGCCLTYDYVTDDDAADLLGERDLDLISMLGGLLMSRPVSSNLSHKHALQKCIERAKLWLENSDKSIEPDSAVTYAGLKMKLKKIMASDYFTTVPEMKAPVEVAAAAGNYGSYQVPVHDNVVPVHVESSDVQYQQKEEEPENIQSNGSNDNQPSSASELYQEEQELENLAEHPSEAAEHPNETDLADNQAEYGKNMESKEQQFASRRPYQNYRGGRGGGRRGYSNGRGGRINGRGGSYQNGRSQYHDQPGNYYQRNYNYRGRGNRGGGNGGNYNQHHVSGGHAGQDLADS